MLFDSKKSEGTRTKKMDQTSYDIWAVRINEAIRVNKRRSGTLEPKGESPSLKDLLLEFAGEAAAIVGAIGRNIEDVEILGGDRHTTMEGFLDEMLKFQEFSFLEYRYKISSATQEPGLRFKVETHEPDSQIVVQHFEDLVFWPVDELGRRIFTEPIRFDLGGGAIGARPHPDRFRVYEGCTSWQGALRETLVLPFRHLYALPFVKEEKQEILGRVGH